MISVLAKAWAAVLSLGPDRVVTAFARNVAIRRITKLDSAAWI